MLALSKNQIDEIPYYSLSLLRPVDAEYPDGVDEINFTLSPINFSTKLSNI